MVGTVSQTVSADAIVTYASATTDTGVSIEANPLLGNMTLEKAGLYLVMFNATITTGTTAGTVTPQITANGAAVPGASATVTASTTATTESVSIPYLLSVGGSCCNVDNSVTIAVTNAGDQGATFVSPTLTAIKLA